MTEDNENPEDGEEETEEGPKVDPTLAATVGEERVPPCPGCAHKEPPDGLAHVTHGCLRERRTDAAFKEIGFA